ncbi:hypothetical protein FISHEDRAFT_68986 [Fistulina hepatica ATCC 64428]|uniref:BHLH domain-containing protein n=1 Tax=Fistulina hepatica ATCC 64428 TaxID=1128425 RepID=A0A0D7APZ2_9AGAR|nr:hypothetical protein FISHEDRAFT_68986 [Fistulina hepatica ATCC 64428]
MEIRVVCHTRLINSWLLQSELAHEHKLGWIPTSPLVFPRVSSVPPSTPSVLSFMPEQILYVGSYNPARRAKRLCAESNAALIEDGAVGSDSSFENSSPEPEPARVPSKRGRKAGSGMSRSAREAQRKLNHSIIEKARRTKINDALATLRQLVPADYAKHKEGIKEDEQQQLAERTGKGGPRRKEDKEFKLEILVKTVSYMQDLLERIEDFEQKEQQWVQDISTGGECAGCKRKREVETDCEQSPSGDKNLVLPPISSWLGPQTSPPHSPRSHLPSPPGSTEFLREHHAGLSAPPPLNLGPPAETLSQTSSSPSPSSPSLEDESAASLLLHMRNPHNVASGVHTPSSLMSML